MKPYILVEFMDANLIAICATQTTLLKLGFAVWTLNRRFWHLISSPFIVQVLLHNIYFYSKIANVLFYDIADIKQNQQGYAEDRKNFHLRDDNPLIPPLLRGT